ncbi:MAG: response regulator [Elusimicrobia bacterium]|nr:response regulator [Elusimicrobiota bacterium]
MDGLVGRPMLKRRLLLIEDEGYVISRVQEILSAFPYFEVTRTDDAERARALLDEKPFDVVLSDVYLRGASGLEFSFKALQKNKDACVVLITGIDNADMAAKAVKEGAFDFVIKPPGLERLAGILKMVSLVRGLAPQEDGEKQP